MLRVLVVDDDLKVRGVLRIMLERAGFEVEEAGSGEEGVAQFRKRPADVVMSDMYMPGRDGLELIRELCREFMGIRIIAMSGGGFDGAVDMLPIARNLGASEVLYKPFSQAAALSAIQKLVEIDTTK